MLRAAIMENLQVADFIASVAEASNGIECLEALKADKFDLIIMDINMPEMDGIECMTKIQEKYPDQRVVILTQYDSPGFYRRFESLGISGYVLKSASADVLLSAVKSAFQNQERFVSHGVKRNVQALEGSEIKITDRELSILMLICEGSSTQEIGESLGLSTNTINTHRKRILKKVGARNPSQLVSWAVRNDLYR